MLPRRMAVASLLAVAVTVLALAVGGGISVTASAAPAPPGPGSGAASGASHLQLTANTNAGCNARQKKGFAQCFAVVRTRSDHVIAADAAGPPPTALGPADIQDAYKLPTDAGAGQTVAIVDAFGYSTAEQDLAVFRANYGLPPCTADNGCFTKVDQRGGTNYPPDDSGWALETALDLDAVSSACPNCHILLVEGDDNGLDSLASAEDEAVALGAKYVSNSYGAGDTGDPGGFDTHYDHPGVAVVASGGDTGNIVDWPSSVPTVTSAGGTRLTRDAATARGWDESVWGSSTAAGSSNGTGSGCSSVEPKPDYQNGVNTNCSMRATTDISADADPQSGLAVYDTLGTSGWHQVGGTSLASPLITAMYALAGPPTTGTYPVTYPYDAAAQAHLFDITDGVNSNCGTVLCTAGPGWDGPTGWGTPNGVAALTTGPHGDIAGRATDATSGAPVADATVSTPQGYKAATDDNGDYDLRLPIGAYDVTASLFGYVGKTQPGVQVEDGQTTTVNFALQKSPTVTLSGVVTDGSGHGWPLSAQVSIDGSGRPPIYTDPLTGRYSMSIPAGATYTIRASALDSGYQPATHQVTVGTSDQTQDIKLVLDESACDAPGYKFNYSGPTEGFDGGIAPAGWTVTNAPGTSDGWRFQDPSTRYDGNQTGGSGGFAGADPNYDVAEDTELVTPAIDLSAEASPILEFDTYGANYFSLGTVEADLSLDDGATWAPVWAVANGIFGPSNVTVPLPQAAHTRDVRVRFHFVTPQGNAASLWQIDNVFVGDRSCDSIPGGLLTGTLTDANTGKPLNGATVTSATNPAATATSGPTPTSGSYRMFVSPAGSNSFAFAAPYYYASVTKAVDVAADKVTQQNVALTAGRLAVSPSSLSVTQQLGSSKTQSGKITVRNTGTAPVTVKLTPQLGGFSPSASPSAARTAAAPPGSGAPLQLLSGHYGLRRTPAEARSTASGAPAARPAAGSSWTTGSNYPAPVFGNAVATDLGSGELYSVGDQYNTNAGYTYDPYTGSWSRLPDMPNGRYLATASFVGGKLYVLGGTNGNDVQAQVEIYDTATQSWSLGATAPTGTYASAAATLNGKIYVVGGCSATACGTTGVQIYDPARNTWSSAPAYPEPTAAEACAATGGKIYCTGGTPDGATGTTHSYVYNPATGTWSAFSSLPIDLWGMAYTSASGQLVVSGGVTDLGTAVTNQGFAYTPGVGWNPLPNSPDARYLAGSGCGFYIVGGQAYNGAASTSTQLLPGYNDCGSASNVPWLSATPATTTLAPGASTTIAIALSANDPSITQPGTYTASLAVVNATPYPVAGNPIAVAMRVTPPKTWGEITGTITAKACDGSTTPLPGAIVEVSSRSGSSWTLMSGPDGHYQLWLDKKNNPLSVIATASGRLSQARTVNVVAGAVTTANLTLPPSGGCN